MRLLRLRGVRVSVTEALDAMRAAAAHGALADRETLRCVLRVTLVKDRRDEELFDELFDRYFRLEPVAAAEPHGHNHAHDDLADTGTAESFTISPEASQTPQQGHSHGKPADIRDFFRQQDLAAAYNLHQEASKIDLASMTDEIVLSKERGRSATSGLRVQLDTSRLHGGGLPGKLQSSAGTRLDAGLTVAEEQALLDWLGDPDGDDPAGDTPEEVRAALARASGGEIANLRELLKRHLEALAAMDRLAIESPEGRGVRTPVAGEAERRQLEETLRRLGQDHAGRPHPPARGRRSRPRRPGSHHAHQHALRRNPVPAGDGGAQGNKPRLVVLADVSLSVRHTARFTLYFVLACSGCSGRCARSRSWPTRWRSPTCSPSIRPSARWRRSSAATCSTSTPTPTTAPRSGDSARSSPTW